MIPTDIARVAPYYCEQNIAIYHADYRDVLDGLLSIRAKSFDLLLTDPPYGHGDRWSGGTWASDPMYDDAKRWDVVIPPGDLVALIRTATHAIIWGGNYYPLPPSRCWLSWLKASSMTTLADFELAWTNLDQPSKQYREQRNPDGKRYHPTQKPESLMRWAIAQVADVRTVFDPMMGAGTTLVAAQRLGLAAIGLDVDERYCAMAVERLRQRALNFSA